MKEIPILFSTPMVQAILEGRKTMTRRTKGLDLINEFPNEWKYSYWAGSPFKDRASDIPGGKDLPRHEFIHKSNGSVIEVECRYGQPGDILWVRETFMEVGLLSRRYSYRADVTEQIYEVDGDGFHVYNSTGMEKMLSWKPSIHMPKAACRIFLKVKSVKVERLQDITEQDAIAEGVLYYGDESGDYKNYEYNDLHGDDWGFLTAKQSFQSLWKSINGPDSWEANPWVWVIEFERVEKP